MKNQIFIIIMIASVLCSCIDQSKIRVQNLVHNASLENVSYGDYSVTFSIFPGETSSRIVINDFKNDWPKSSQVEFYMVRDGNRVFLKTKASYTLDAEEDLLIVIADTTEVVSPFGKKSGNVEDFK